MHAKCTALHHVNPPKLCMLPTPMIAVLPRPLSVELHCNTFLHVQFATALALSHSEEQMKINAHYIILNHIHVPYNDYFYRYMHLMMTIFTGTFCRDFTGIPNVNW